MRGSDTRRRRRRYIRHPVDVPLEVESVPGDHGSRVSDVSFGGLSFLCAQSHRPGTELVLRIPYLEPSFEVRARVAWRRRESGGYRIGVRFLAEDDAYRSRMVEQICAIESYRNEVRDREGRDLTSAEAAQEWIERYASRFPDP